MKKTLTTITIFLSLLTINVSGQHFKNLQWYGLGGVIFTNGQDLDTKIGEGLEFKFGFGVELTDRFGIELLLDHASPLDENVLLSQIERERNVVPFKKDIVLSPITYYGIAGTFSTSLNDRISFVARGGIAAYRTDWDIEINNIDLSYSERGTTPMFSLGLELNAQSYKSKITYDISVTHYSEENVRTTFFGLSMKFNFSHNE